MLNRLLLVCFLLTSSILMYAQGMKTISGVVTDSSTGEELIGATVKSSSNDGVITDVDGRYTLHLEGNKITISYIGYTTKEMNIGNSGVYNVQLVSNSNLDEVVVVGYGVQRKSDLTGSISSISGDELKNQAASNVSGLLAGKASGVFVGNSSGQPGSSAVVRIRGVGTVNDNNPLYVVDGQFMDDINNLNPSDIERMEVLKDASALAIYGSRGANGVIIITTKRGIQGKTTITFDMSLGINKVYKTLNMMNSDQYYDFLMTANGWDQQNPTGNAYNLTQLYKRGYNTNWWDEATQTGLTQTYNLSMRKGTEDSRTAFSIGYIDDQGTIITTDFSRLSARLSQEYDIQDVVTLGVNLNVANMKQRKANALSSFQNILAAEPFSPVINPLVDPNSANYQYNKYAPTEWTFNKNPISDLKLPNRYNDMFNVFGNAFANVKLMKGLSYRFQYSFERNNNKYHEFTPLYVNTFTEYTVSDKAGKATNNRPSLYESEGRTLNQTFENRVNYYTDLGKHHIDVMGAITYENRSSESFSAYGAGAIGNDEDYEVLDSHPDSQSVGGAKLTTSMMSYIGRLNYAYDNRYLLTASFRADGSSAFAKDNRWGSFPSVALGWRITEEAFMKDISIRSWLDNLKLRAGWGRNGNARIPQDAALTLVGTSKNDKWSFDGTTFDQGYYLKYTGNKNLIWEISQQTNIGLDATLFSASKNALSLSFDYYIKDTKDVLLPFELPAFGGYTNNPYMNAGEIRNTGFDFSANYTNYTNKDLTINVGLNLSAYKTNVRSLSVDNYALEYLSGDNGRTYTGGAFNRFWGYQVLGIFQNQAEIDSYTDAHGQKIQPNAEPGDFKFANLNNENPLNDDDRTFIGNPNPDLIFGFNVGLDYKNVDFSMSFQGTLGNDIWNSTKGSLAGVGFQNALEEAYTNAWRVDGDQTKYPRMTATNPNQNYRGSSFYVEDGSYIRLQNVQIGYTLPSYIARSTKIFSSLRIFASSQNLFTITKYTGLDPDLSNDSPLAMGVDGLRYPSPRTFLFGLNVEF